MPACHDCGLQLTVGDVAYVSDWQVIDVGTGQVRGESRYKCEECELS